MRGLAQVAGLNKLPGAFVETTATGQVVTVSSNTVKFDHSAMRLLTGEKQLQKLGLLESSITDAELACIGSARSLVLLSLPGAGGITDASAGVMALFSELEHLDLCWSQVSDASIPSLAGLKKLKFLDVRKTQITKEGVARLRQLLPNTEVDY